MNLLNMKKYILILFSILCLASCSEDESVDITVMPPATVTGADTFGFLADGWVYVGGRYLGWNGVGEWPAKSFRYDPKEERLTANVGVKENLYITFTILSPQEGKACALTHIRFGEEEQEDGTAHISCFDTKRKIISGTFENGARLTNGRFDIHYSTLSSDSPSE